MNRPKTPKGQKTKRRIIENSIKVINRKGFTNTTLQDICSAAGVGNGTFYHYFSSTGDILRELLVMEFEQIEELYQKVRTKPVIEQLYAVIEFQLAYFDRKGRDIVATIYRQELQASTGLIDPDTYITGRILQEIIERGQMSGEFKGDQEAGECRVQIISLILYFSFQWLLDPGGPGLRDKAYGEVIRLANRILLPEYYDA